MTRIDELKNLLRNAPTIESTHADLKAEFAKLQPHYNALKTRLDELESQVASFAAAREELGISQPVAVVEEIQTGEPTPAPSSAAKPNKQGNKK